MTSATPRPLWREVTLLLLLAAVPALLSAWLHPRRPTWTWTKPEVSAVDLNEVARWPAPVLWVDAREAHAYTKEHIPGAVLLNETEWNRLVPGFLEAWRPGAKVVVYCGERSCNASEEVARRLRRELNLPDVFVLKGGWVSWKNDHR